MNLVPFTEWPLNSILQENLQKQGFVIPTEVQQACWQPLRDGADLLVQSCTGTGKTLAFALPLLNDPANSGASSILIVLPTRELAMQVAGAISAMGTRPALLYGGGGYGDQLRALKSGASVVVGTPGRLVDHIERGTLNLSSCRALVLDEADEILDLGFAEEIDKILNALPKERQSLLFSATLPPQMEALAAKTLKDSCRRISVSVGLAAAGDITHEAYAVAKPWRAKALSNVLYVENPQMAIVFCHTRAETEELSEELIGLGMSVLSLHGDMAQAERTRTLNRFRSGASKYLIATDVAARGLDVQGVTHVINMSVPQNIETYIHRVGRTGRAGHAGKAITFIAPFEQNRFKKLLSRANIKLQMGRLPQAEEVRRRLKAEFHKNVGRLLAEKVDDKMRLLASELLCYLSPVDSLAAVLSMLPEAEAVFTGGTDVKVPKEFKHSEETKPVNKLVQKMADKAASSAGSNLKYIQVNIGRADGMSPNALLHLLDDAAGISKAEAGNIEMRSHTSFVEVPADDAENAASALNGYEFGTELLKARVIEPAAVKILIGPKTGVQERKHGSDGRHTDRSSSRRREGGSSEGFGKGKRRHEDKRGRGGFHSETGFDRKSSAGGKRGGDFAGRHSGSRSAKKTLFARGASMGRRNRGR